MCGLNQFAKFMAIDQGGDFRRQSHEVVERRRRRRPFQDALTELDRVLQELEFVAGPILSVKKRPENRGKITRNLKIIREHTYVHEEVDFCVR